MRAKPLSLVLICACLTTISTTSADENAEEQIPASCGPSFERAGAVNTPYQVRSVSVVPVGGNGWSRLHQTTTGEARLAVVGPNETLQVYDPLVVHDALSGEPLHLSTQKFLTPVTRGVWDVGPHGESVIRLGEDSALEHVTLGKESSLVTQRLDCDTPVRPLAATDGGVTVDLVKQGRVRVIPAPPMSLTNGPIDVNVSSSIRTGFLFHRNRQWMANISAEGKLDVFVLSKDPQTAVWSRTLASGGANTTLAWFVTDENQPALAVLDDDGMFVVQPLRPDLVAVSMPIPGSTRARARLRTATTNLHTVLLAPGTEGTRIFKFAHDTLVHWFDLDAEIAGREVAMFATSRDRVHIAWIKSQIGHDPELHLAQIDAGGGLIELEDKKTLFPGEEVSDSDAIEFTGQSSDPRHIVSFRTNYRVLVLELVDPAREVMPPPTNSPVPVKDVPRISWRQRLVQLLMRSCP